MAALGNISRNIPHVALKSTPYSGPFPSVSVASKLLSCRTIYTFQSPTTSVIVNITEGIPFRKVQLLNNSALILESSFDASGNLTFYDLDDGEYMLRDVSQYGIDMWNISIINAVVTVAKVSGSAATRSYAFIST